MKPGRRSDVDEAALARLGARIADLAARYSGPAPQGQPEHRVEAEAEAEVADGGPPDAEREEPPWRQEAVGLIVVFVATRLALIAIGLVSRELWPGPVVRPRPLGVGPSFSSLAFLDLWAEWDSSWYLSIAEHGYKPEPLVGALANYAFFPLYPMLCRGVGWLFGGPFVGGLVVSNASFMAACFFLYRLVRLDDDVGTARRAVKYLFAAPAAFLFSAMLTESVYLALLVMCFYFARTRRWWAVGLLGFLLALTRGPGVLAVIPLAWMYLGQRRFSLRRVRPDVAWLGLLPAGVGLFMWFNQALTGDALAFAHIQLTGWGHRLHNPLSGLWRAVSGDDVVTSFNGWYMAAVLVLAMAFLRRFGVAYALFVLISLLVPLSYSAPGGSMVRYTAVIFPFYVVAARLTRDRPGLDQAVTIAMALLQGFLMSHWANNSLLVI